MSIHLFFVLILVVVFASGVQSRQNHVPPPTHYFVLGDRYSGVNYVSNLLRNHTKESSNTNPLRHVLDAHLPIRIPLEECQIRGHDDYDEPRALDTHIDQDWKYGFLTVTQLRQNLDCNIDDTLFIMVTKVCMCILVCVCSKKSHVIQYSK